MNNKVAVCPSSTVELNGYVIPSTSRISTEVLIAKDRCDASECGAAARVRTVKDTATLLFCAHHARKNIRSLVEKGWMIDDQTVQKNS